MEFKYFDSMDLINDNWSYADAWFKPTQAASHVFTFVLLSDAYKLFSTQWISRF